MLSLVDAIDILALGVPEIALFNVGLIPLRVHCSALPADTPVLPGRLHGSLRGSTVAWPCENFAQKRSVHGGSALMLLSNLFAQVDPTHTVLHAYVIAGGAAGEVGEHAVANGLGPGLLGLGL